MAAAPGPGARWLSLALLAAAAVVAASEEEGEEELSPRTKAVNLGISVMLLLTVTFVMVLFWLVNHYDEEIRMYSWQVISQTISIFCAVLLFAAFDDVFDWLFLPKGGHVIVLNCVQMLLWFMGLQILLATLSGAVDEWIPGLNTESVTLLRGDTVEFMGVGEPGAKTALTLRTGTVEVGTMGKVRGYSKKDDTKIVVDFPTCRATVPVHNVKKEWKLSSRRRKAMACWATLLGHITGFSAINFFAEVQAQVPGYFTSLAVALLAWVSVFMICKFTMRFRDYVSLADDGELDEAEKLWAEETEETEDDIIGLSVSFLIVQWARYVITGRLPNPEGQDPGDFHPSPLQILALFSFGIGVYFFESWFVTLRKVHYGKLTGHARLISGMVLAWSLFFGFTWLTDMVMFSTRGMLKQIVIAGCTTMVSIQIIFVLDTIADGIKERSAAQTQAPGIEAGDYEGDDVKALAAKNLANIKQVEKVVRSVVVSVGILIGFAWEKSFDIAVEVTAESVDWCPDAVTKMLMSLVLAGIVIPNWTNHILPKIIEYKRLEEAEEHGGVSHHHGPKHSTGSFEAGSRESSLGDLSEPLLKQMPRGTSHRTEVADEANRELLEAYKRRNEELEANLVDVIKEIKSLQAIASEPVPASAQHR